MNQAYDLVSQRKQRLKKIEALRALGINPFPARSNKNIENDRIDADFDAIEGTTVTIAGRVRSWRAHGKVVFADIYDQTGKAQAYIRHESLDADLKNGCLGWDELHFIDDGDFIEVTGEVTKTQKGEPSVLAKNLRILAKTIRPLPDDLENKELRYRRRYLDLTAHPEIRERFLRKAAFWRAHRTFLEKNGFIEVETPVLEHVTGGADARPFVTHHNDLDEDFYLRISTELFQKRLIGGGFEKIFTIGPNFRNEGVSDEHLQEYYQAEWYWAYTDFRDNMKLVRDLFRFIALEVYGKTTFTTRGHTFDLADEWEEIDYVQILKERFGIDIFTTSEQEMNAILHEYDVRLDGDINRNRLIDNLWKLIRKDISGPAFLINEPKFMSPLAKSRQEDERLTERFHVIIGGSELGNGYSEINDPQDQLERFIDQQNMRDAGDDEAQMLDIDYVEMLEYGMPPTSGYGQSERIFWFLEDVTAREGTLFPLMKQITDKTTEKIYGKLHHTLAKTDNVSVSTNFDGLPTRDEAEKLLVEHVNDEYQLLHARMVAKAMEMYASEYGEKVDLWYITGLLHDLDYTNHPDEHPNLEIEWFKKWGYPDSMIHAIAAHAPKRTDVEPKSRMAYALLSIDELSGLMYAYALMRDDGFDGMEAKGVKKKMKDKSFAAKIDRNEIQLGIELLGVDQTDHFSKLIAVFAEYFPIV